MKNRLKHIIPVELIDSFLSNTNHKHIDKGEYYIHADEIPGKFALILNGLFRYVYIDDNGTEYTKGIIDENNFISSYSAMISNSPSHFYIEALEPSEIVELTYNNWQQMRQKNEKWNEFLVQILEKAFTKKEKREREFLLLNAEARYNIFLQEHPGIDQRVNQRIIASYLGIQPESLSRIRSKIRS